MFRKNDCLFLAAIDFDGEGRGETDVADMGGFLDGGEVVEDFLTIDAVASEGVDGEVADAKGGEVLEEVGALRGVNLEAIQACLHDDLCRADLRPLDGNAKPRVGTSPTARAN